MSRGILKLVHVPRFRSSRSLWMYNELKIVYGNDIPDIKIETFSDIAEFRERKPQWLLELNPNGKVPTMVYGTTVMFESGAICSFLLDQFDTKRILLPRNVDATATYYLMVSWAASTLDNLCATSSPINIILNKSEPTIRPMDNVETNQKYFNQIVIPFIQNKLIQNKGPYLCGADFTASDIILGYHLLMAKEKMQPSWLSASLFPEVNTYMDLLRSRPALLAAIAPV